MNDLLGETTALHINRSNSYSRWGQLPLLCLAVALALFLIAIADMGARNQTSWAEPLFWVGLLLMFMPIALRMIGTDVSRRERIGLVIILGMALYAVKLMNSPLYFTFMDELKAWRSTDDLLAYYRLFHENPTLPVSPLYPGLENVTSALVSLSGLDIFAAGVIVIASARLVLVVALFLLYENILGSARVAGIAALIYMSDGHFLYFDAQFSYKFWE